MKHIMIILLFYAALSTCIFAADTVRVDLLNEHQTILGNGINFEGYHRRKELGFRVLKSLEKWVTFWVTTDAEIA